MDSSETPGPEREISPAVRGALTQISDELGLTVALRCRLLDLASGLTYEGISRKHGITVNTVKTEIRQLLRRLGLYCRHEIDHAVDSAEVRIDAGASEAHVLTFLRLRWE